MQHLFEKTGLSWLFARKTAQQRDDAADGEAASKPGDSTLQVRPLDDYMTSDDDSDGVQANLPRIQALLPLSHWMAKARQTGGSEQASEGASRH